MVRRKRKAAAIEAPAVLAAGACLFILWLLLRNPSVVIVLGLAIVAVVATIVAVTIVMPARNRRSLIDKANAGVDQNADRLARRRAQLVRQDAYGKPVLEKWVEEINYFINEHVGPSLTTQEQSLLKRERAGITQAIMRHVEQVVRDRPAFDSFSDKMTPVEFEAFCAEQLRQSGWDAHVTRQSRDQGVDVIAEKNGLRIVLQCKLYSAPVGNKAVQEAVAARAFEQAHYCAVVSNSSYTSAAEQLASTNKVLLLHYSDLKQIESLLREATVSD
jgi:restriction system protein